MEARLSSGRRLHDGDNDTVRFRYRRGSAVVRSATRRRYPCAGPHRSARTGRRRKAASLCQAVRRGNLRVNRQTIRPVIDKPVATLGSRSLLGRFARRTDRLRLWRYSVSPLPIRWPSGRGSLDERQDVGQLTAEPQQIVPVLPRRLTGCRTSGRRAAMPMLAMQPDRRFCGAVIRAWTGHGVCLLPECGLDEARGLAAGFGKRLRLPFACSGWLSPKQSARSGSAPRPRRGLCLTFA